MLVEAGFSCDTTLDAQSTCKEICGDGVNMGVNECDDGNTDSFDGCGTYCTVDPGFTCTGGSTTKEDTCTQICGDGLIMNSRPSATYCDDGNSVSGDGCNSGCLIESGYSCTGGSSSTSDTCTEVCGDGIKFKQACDDGNSVGKDG